MRKTRTFGDLPDATDELVATREMAVRRGAPDHLVAKLATVLEGLPPTDIHKIALSAWRAASAAYIADADVIARRKAMERLHRTVVAIRRNLEAAISGPDLRERDTLLDQAEAAQARGRWADADALLDRAVSISTASPVHVAAHDHARRRRGPVVLPLQLDEARAALVASEAALASMAQALSGAGAPVSRLGHFGRILWPLWQERRRRETATPARDLRGFLDTMALMATGTEPSARLIDAIADNLRRNPPV